MSDFERPLTGARRPLRNQRSLDLFASKPNAHVVKSLTSVREVPDPRGEPGSYETLCHDCDRVVIRVPEGVASDFDAATGRTTPIEFLEVIAGRILPHHCERRTLDDHQIADLMPPICGGSGAIEGEPDPARVAGGAARIALFGTDLEDPEEVVRSEAQAVIDEIRRKVLAGEELSDQEMRGYSVRILSAVDRLAAHDEAHGSPVISPSPDRVPENSGKACGQARPTPDEQPLRLGSARPVPAPKTLPGGAEVDIDEDEELEDDDFETDDGDDDYDEPDDGDDAVNAALRKAFAESAVAAGFTPLPAYEELLIVRHEGRIYRPETIDSCDRCGKIVLVNLASVDPMSTFDPELGPLHTLRGAWVVEDRRGFKLVPHDCRGGAR